MGLHRSLGIDRAVVVQPGAHGTDNSALLDALAAADGRYRGVVLLDDHPDNGGIARLDAAGVRGVRFSFMAHLGPPPGEDYLGRIVSAVGPLGWHLVVHIDPAGLARIPSLLDFGLPVVIDHMARLDASLGLDQPAFRDLLRLLKNDLCWVKLSGADRISRTGSPYADAVPFAARLLAATPDRVLWGTDFPHPNHPRPPDDAELVDLLSRFAPDPDDRQRLLVDNPGRLYRFEEPLGARPGNA